MSSGAFFLAINTWHIKYTSQVMLEALPSLLSLIAAGAAWNWLAALSILMALPVVLVSLVCGDT